MRVERLCRSLCSFVVWYVHSLTHEVVLNHMVELCRCVCGRRRAAPGSSADMEEVHCSRCQIRCAILPASDVSSKCSLVSLHSPVILSTMKNTVDFQAACPQVQTTPAAEFHVQHMFSECLLCASDYIQHKIPSAFTMGALHIKGTMVDPGTTTLAGAVLGCASGIVGWLVTAQTMSGEISIASTGTFQMISTRRDAFFSLEIKKMYRHSCCRPATVLV